MIERKVKSVRALERGLDVLTEIQRRRATNLHELHTQLQLPKATLLRMLVTLSSRGLIWQRLADGAYLPSGLSPVGMDNDAGVSQMAEIASPYLAQLSNRVTWPSVMGVPRLDHVEIIETNSPLMRFDSTILGPVGAKLSYIHTATGRAYLAACDERERDAIIERLKPADASPASVAALNALIAEIQQRGYSTREPAINWPDMSRAQVLQDGRRSIAVPVVTSNGACAAINITWPARRVSTQQVVDQHLAALIETAQLIGAAIDKIGR